MWFYGLTYRWKYMACKRKKKKKLFRNFWKLKFFILTRDWLSDASKAFDCMYHFVFPSCSFQKGNLSKKSEGEDGLLLINALNCSVGFVVCCEGLDMCGHLLIYNIWLLHCHLFRMCCSVEIFKFPLLGNSERFFPPLFSDVFLLKPFFIDIKNLDR